MLAWIEANLNYEGNLRAAMAQFASAVLREQDRATGDLNRIVRELVPEHLKSMVASGYWMHDVLGTHEAKGTAWKAGLADLSEREAEAFELRLRPIWDEEEAGWRWPSSVEIGRLMKPSKRTGMALPPDAVDVLLSRARRKVRELFGLEDS